MSSTGKGNFPLTFQLQVQGDAEITNRFNQVKTSMAGISPEAAKVQTGVSNLGKALTSSGQQATQSSTTLKGYSGALTSLSGGYTPVVTGTTNFSGALSGMNTQVTAARGGLTDANTVVRSSISPMAGLGTETTKTGGAVSKLTDFFRGNKGLIFSTTMLSTGIFEAIGMFQGLQDASAKLAAAEQKVNDLQSQGKEGTKEYADATKELTDAKRGYNFIARFTAQSFGDLIPMSLLLVSSLLNMSSSIGGLTAVKTKLGKVVTKLTGAFRGLGTAIGGAGAAGLFASLTNPISLVMIAITAVTAAVIALATNFGGFRDAVNNAGVALGEMFPRFQGILTEIGKQGNALLDTINSWLGFGQTASAESQTVQQEMQQLSAAGQTMGKVMPEQWKAVEEAVKTSGDATVLSVEDQIEVYNRLGEESKDVAFSVAAHMDMRTMAEKEHAEQYAKFVLAITSEDDKLAESMGMTEKQFQEFYKEWQEEIKAFAETHNQSIDTIIANWDSFKETQTSAATSLIEEITKINEEITELTQKEWDMDSKDEINKTEQEIQKLVDKLDELQGKVSQVAIDAADDLAELARVGKESLDAFSLEVLGGNFSQAIETLQTAIDDVPAKYQSNFSEIESIINNTALTNRQKVAEIVADYGSLEQAFKPLTEGAYSYSRAQAELTTTFDELAVAARANVTDMEQMEGAWNAFLESLTPAQKSLPVIQDLIARVEAGTTSFGDALAEVEALGRKMSATLGETVVTSFADLEKVIVAMPDGTKKAFGLINDQVVDLGTTADSQFLSGSKSVSNSAKNMTTQTQTQFETMGTNITNLETTMKTKTESMGSAWDAMVKGMADAWKGAQGTWDGIVKFFSDIGGQVGGFFTQSNFRTGQGGITNVAGGGGGGFGIASALTTEMANALTIVKNGITAIQTAFSGLSTSLATYANSMKTNLGTFFTYLGQAFPMLDNLIKAHQQTWSGFSTSVSTYANSMQTNLNNFITAVSQGLNSLSQVIATHRQAWSTLSTSISTYANSMRSNIQSFVSTTTSSFNSLRSAITSLQSTASKLSTSWKTYMNSMASAAKSFANTTVSAFKSVISAANSLVSALKKVESQARSAAKAAAGVRGMQHGGAMVAAQRGFSGIVSSPSTYKGVHMGEGFSPELITVTPLTRGTGNHFGPTANSFSGQSGQPIVNNITVVLDGRVIQRFVEKTALSNVGIQI